MCESDLRFARSLSLRGKVFGSLLEKPVMELAVSFDEDEGKMFPPPTWEKKVNTCKMQSDDAEEKGGNIEFFLTDAKARRRRNKKRNWDIAFDLRLTLLQKILGFRRNKKFISPNAKFLRKNTFLFLSLFCIEENFYSKRGFFWSARFYILFLSLIGSLAGRRYVFDDEKKFRIEQQKTTSEYLVSFEAERGKKVISFWL